MLKLVADGLALTVPSKWSEVTLGQFLNYLEATTDAEVLTALSGVPISELRPKSHVDLRHVISLLAWREEVPYFPALPIVKALVLGEQTLIIPENLSQNLTVGQQWDIEDAIRNLHKKYEKDTYVSLARTLLCICLYPVFSGQPYSTHEQAQSIVHLIDGMPVTDALPLANAMLNWMENPAPQLSSLKFLQTPTNQATWWHKLKYWLFIRGIYLPGCSYS